jgi:hypothetical protein
MIRFFGNQEKSKLDSTESRLRSMEWKINFVLGVAVLHITLTALSFLKDTFIPSPITLALVAVLTIGGLWLFRRPLWRWIKQKLLRSMLDEDGGSKPANVPGTDESIH